MNAYLLLLFAIISEVVGSSLLKATDGFRRPLPTLGVVAGYGLAFYALSLTLLTLPLGLTYAVWSGLGTALTAMVGVIVYKEGFGGRKLAGLAMIIAGVILLNIGGAE
ncbi:Multidrug resistance protein EbrA [Bhargavaea cecembensis DSE10]|uniref:Multidrug resistance protein EbrA n=1 Tax=Bhargavaea cecembensis DSE10 TaxID=1235279 RepID=M7NAG3_9BACL|nr:multidrug efflux SMR transporter [Bhargavaea cecembensis]EMR05588.1 Multidrug resistance protein EbrA [Bhargavaea cecembensis DSE10]